MTIEALIFDVDGTLADTEEAHREAFNRAFEQLRVGLQWSRADYKRLLGITGGKERITASIEENPFTPAQRKSLLARVPEIHAAKTAVYTQIAEAGGIPLRPGIQRLIEEARAAGMRLAIASTTTAANIDALLHATLGDDALSLFDVIACGDQVRHKKPAPDIYRLALETLGVAPERAVAFEDSENGLRSAVAAGVWTVITPNYWTEDGQFGTAALVLPNLGDPARPLPHEPGGSLRLAAWLTMDELLRRACPERPLDAVQALYQGAH
jgi:HAD superfamily hydrolase (TIGR01509 family)